MLKPTDFSLGNTSSAEIATQPPFAIFPSANDRPGLSLLGLSKPQGLGQVYATPAHIDEPAATRRTPPISVEEVSQSIASDPFSLFDDPTTPLTPQRTAVSISTSEQVPSKEQWTVGSQSAPPNQLSSRLTPSATATVRNTDTTPAQTPKAAATATTRERVGIRSLSKLSTRARSLTYLSAPVVAAMGLLLTIGYSSYLAPQTLDAGLRAVVPSLITGPTSKLPPSELSVQEISLEFVKTQSHEGIGIVRGVVHNNADSTLNNVRLEALGFDDRGQIVVRAQAPLRSALAREKASDLSLATVRKFQESLSASSSKIAAGERVAFSIALLDSSSGEAMPVDLSKVRYFSARVFSVGQ